MHRKKLIIDRALGEELKLKREEIDEELSITWNLKQLVIGGVTSDPRTMAGAPISGIRPTIR